ncbi:hypothetical protein DPMN_055843 [Dreissena polymorpha]|uniref:Uncharacterized protein n=1 Tax=Dreissena polymorpha TaxID=45954 RepID=A0A9D4HT28_DREPO|nr:hypothetical protein DPMN_055843 [Dreissena polymorpha]
METQRGLKGKQTGRWANKETDDGLTKAAVESESQKGVNYRWNHKFACCDRVGNAKRRITNEDGIAKGVEIPKGPRVYHKRRITKGKGMKLEIKSEGRRESQKEQGGNHRRKEGITQSSKSLRE